MSDTNEAVATAEAEPASTDFFAEAKQADDATPQWGRKAPRGAKAVLNRIVKDGANVPLFVGQTLVNSLRDTGYNTTTSAVCEHVDNGIEAGARSFTTGWARNEIYGRENLKWPWEALVGDCQVEGRGRPELRTSYALCLMRLRVIRTDRRGRNLEVWNVKKNLNLGGA